jgi:SnoaL-like domain
MPESSTVSMIRAPELTPHPAKDTRAFAGAYAQAWAEPPFGLLRFFATDGTYTDVAQGAVFTGHAEISRFHTRMRTISPNAVMEFQYPSASDGYLYMQWQWEGAFAGPLRLRDGGVVAPGDRTFRVDGVAVCTYEPEGKLTRHRQYWNPMTLTDQLRSLDTYIAAPRARD